MKTITVRDENNTPYTLAFTAESVKALEAQGFVPDELSSKPMTMIPMFFEGALLAKHGSDVSSEKALEIYQAQKDKVKLLAKMLELYNEPITEVIAPEGNAEWECNF